MRLTQYINDREQDIDKFIVNVKKDCKPWLSAIKNCTRKSLYRGYDGKNIDKKNVRTDRRPKDMPIDIHNDLDELFLKKFGWKARSEGLFGSPAITVGNSYGISGGLCFPAGNFKFIWSPNVFDLYMTVSNNKFKWSDIDSYTNKDLCRALSSLNEIMIKCKSYYIIDMIYLTAFLKNDRYEEYGSLLVNEMHNKWIEENFF